MTENSLYAIDQVRPCHITPEEIEVSKVTITLHTKHFRKELNQQNAGYNINARSGTADITTIVALTTLLPEQQVI